MMALRLAIARVRVFTESVCTATPTISGTSPCISFVIWYLSLCVCLTRCGLFGAEISRALRRT